MRAISENLLNKIQSNTRAYDIMLTVYHRYIDADGNISFDTFTDYSSNAELLGVSGLQGATTGFLQLGKTFVSEIDFSLTKNAVCRVGDKVRLWLDFGEGDTITLATAYVDTVSHDQWQSNFTAYDKMMQLNKAYISELTYPASASAVVDEICEQTGLELEPFVFECNPTLKVAPVSPNTDYNGNSVYYSYREILGYIALANASNVVIDEQTEKLKFVKYTDSGSTFDYNKTIRRTINNENYVINAIKVSDTGYSEGNEKGEFEVFFPLVTTQGKEYVYGYLSTHFVGLSYIGMIAQKQGYGIYQIGDLVDYADFDDENYTFAVMGVKYDFSGGYFTEQLYSLAPSEMEAEYSGGIYVGQNNTNITNPVIISEKNKSYLKYDYTSVGYIKGDEAGYGLPENSLICQGYVVKSGLSSVSYDDMPSYKKVSFPTTGAIRIAGSTATQTASDVSVEAIANNFQPNGAKDLFCVLKYTNSDGEYQSVDMGYMTSQIADDWGIFPSWRYIYSPTEENPYGTVDITFAMRYFRDGEWTSLPISRSVTMIVPFANLNEYNMAVQLTNQPLEVFDVVQNVMQIVEGESYADLPEIGTADTLYVTYQPPAVYKYSTVTQSYYCVGRNYKEIQRIVSTTKPDDNEVATYKVPVVFDVRTKAEWELEANTVFPKGFVIFEQEPETREKTKIKIANGIDKLSDLDYNGIDESALDEKADKIDLQAHIDDKSNPHGVTKAQIGLSKVENKSSADILSELEIGGRNFIRNSAFVDGFAPWYIAGSSNITLDTNKMFNNHPSLKCWTSGLTSDKWWGIGTSNLPDINHRLVINKDETWTLSCWYYIEDISLMDRGLQFGVKGLADGSTTSVSVGSIFPTKSGLEEGKWCRLAVSFTASQRFSNCMAVVYIRRNGTIWFTDFKLEKGNKVTDWTPAPEDVDDKITTTISQMNSAIEQKANSIMSTVAQTYTTKDDFNNLEIGGRNLLRGATTLEGNTSGPKITRSKDSEGFYTAFFVAYSPVAWRSVRFASDILPLSAVLGRTVTLSFEVRSADFELINSVDTEGVALTFAVTESTSSLTRVKERGVNLRRTVSLTADWQKVVRTYTITPEFFTDGDGEITAESGFVPYIYLYTQYSGELRKLKLEIGNKATDWTPAPEDAETRVTSLEERVATLEAAILSLGGEV